MAGDGMANTWSSLKQGAIDFGGTVINTERVSGPNGESLVGIRVLNAGGAPLVVLVVEPNSALGLGVDLIEEAFAAAGIPRDPNIDRLRSLLANLGRRK